MSVAVQNSYITSEPGICGGKPCIAGTRIRVQDIFVLHELQGLSVDDIIDGYPHLSQSQVYAALSYYWDHREEIDQQRIAGEALVVKLKMQQGPSALERKLRNQIS